MSIYGNFRWFEIENSIFIFYGYRITMKFLGQHFCRGLHCGRLEFSFHDTIRSLLPAGYIVHQE